MKDFMDCEIEHPHNELIKEVKSLMPKEEHLYDVAELFKVFGDSTRTRILAALFNHELCVCDICKIVDMTKSAVSHQLKVLRDFNLVKYRKQGKEVFYSLADEHVFMIYEKALEHILEKKEGIEE
ncbi:MAG: metalloregulator ArsR/SmtB family transcription factor [Anaeroplasmataceae bacterium]|nr:metalloregulator ArsR/SmtB family transcription factor [Anaeroplasmataceae bacterium]